MSYDDESKTPIVLKRTLRDKLAHRWWSFVLWAALDSRFRWLNRWGWRRLERR